MFAGTIEIVGVKIGTISGSGAREPIARPEKGL
jgi:hypothetical protein